jgi:hypothetical protein
VCLRVIYVPGSHGHVGCENLLQGFVSTKTPFAVKPRQEGISRTNTKKEPPSSCFALSTLFVQHLAHKTSTKHRTLLHAQHAPTTHLTAPPHTHQLRKAPRLLTDRHPLQLLVSQTLWPAECRLLLVSVQVMRSFVRPSVRLPFS